MEGHVDKFWMKTRHSLEESMWVYGKHMEACPNYVGAFTHTSVTVCYTVDLWKWANRSYYTATFIVERTSQHIFYVYYAFMCPIRRKPKPNITCLRSKNSSSPQPFPIHNFLTKIGHISKHVFVLKVDWDQLLVDYVLKPWKNKIAFNYVNPLHKSPNQDHASLPLIAPNGHFTKKTEGM